jgi:hypothetical protein
VVEEGRESHTSFGVNARAGMATSRRFRILLTVGVVSIAAIGTGAILAEKWFKAHAQQYVITAVSEKFDGDVALSNIQLSFLPRVGVVGENLVVRFRGQADSPPLLKVRKFTVGATIAGFFRQPRHVATVEVEGLELHVPPKQDRPQNPRRGETSSGFVADEVIADGMTLEILPKDARKSSLKFELKRLRLTSAGMDQAMSYSADLVNALPPGLIQSTGHIGPWVADDPGGTPLSGQYVFRNADLSVFKAIKGILASDGNFRGQLGTIEVQGTTDVPDFALTAVKHPMHLRTTFEATVDGTNGDTDLHPVHAILGKSEFEVSGAIERGALEHGKNIQLNAKSVKGSLADFLRLAVKGATTPMTGTLSFETKIRIPHEHSRVIDKLDLDGHFTATGVKFTNPDVQQKMANLSHRAEGEPKEHDSDVAMAMAGQFILDDGTMTLHQLMFELPGAQINLDGTYALASGEIDFKGAARMSATVSHMTTGFKSVLLRPIDPLFRRNGAGALLPITIRGNRESPSFKLDIGRALKRGKEP